MYTSRLVLSTKSQMCYRHKNIKLKHKWCTTWMYLHACINLLCDHICIRVFHLWNDHTSNTKCFVKPSLINRKKVLKAMGLYPFINNLWKPDMLFYFNRIWFCFTTVHDIVIWLYHSRLYFCRRSINLLCDFIRICCITRPFQSSCT